ncbi:MAG: phenylalanine--tRNA ligase subunit alpha [bacterium]
MKEDLERLRAEANHRIEEADNLSELDQIRIDYLGRKGHLTILFKRLGQLPPEDRPLMGQWLNQVKEELGRELTRKKEEITNLLQEQALEQEKIDITLPATRLSLGKRHPITMTINDIVHIFSRFGFQIAEGPEVELEYYNFDALNIPKYHPARDMHDTFYIRPGILLRTHTSPIQIRVMELGAPPFRIIAPGRAYRRDASDASHSPVFHQIEGFLVDEETSFSDLKGILNAFVKEFFGKQSVLRFRPSFFPFTEPSAEIDISCVICSGRGCSVCSQTGWLEILGAGMIDPEVFRMVKIDSERYLGFAFGMGIERIAMLKYGINDIRLFYENDLRFLEQF